MTGDRTLNLCYHDLVTKLLQVFQLTQSRVGYNDQQASILELELGATQQAFYALRYYSKRGVGQ